MMFRADQRNGYGLHPLSWETCAGPAWRGSGGPGGIRGGGGQGGGWGGYSTPNGENGLFGAKSTAYAKSTALVDDLWEAGKRAVKSAHETPKAGIQW